MSNAGRAAIVFVSAGVCGTIAFRMLNSWSFWVFVGGAIVGAFLCVLPMITKMRKEEYDNSDLEWKSGSMTNEELRFLYGELGLDTSASDDDVKTAYREMAKRYHPDFYEDAEPNVREAAAERFRRIGDAYALIKYIRGMK